MPPSNQQTAAEFDQPPLGLADGEPLSDLLPSPPRDTPKRLLAPLLLTLLPLAAIVGIGLLAYWLLSGPADAPSQVVAPTPDIEATVQAAVALAVTQEAQSRDAVDPTTPPQIATVTESPSLADAAVVAQESDRDAATNIPTDPPDARWKVYEQWSVAAGARVNNSTVARDVQWMWGPTVSETGWLSLGASIGGGGDGFFEDPTRCTPANVSLSDNNGAFYGWVIPRHKAEPCGPKASDWVANAYQSRGNGLSLSVQLAAAAATHPGLEVCLWTGGPTQNETRLIDCRQVQQP